MQTIINQHAPEFTVQAFQQGNFKTVSNKDIEGKWAMFFFYPADFTFVCPTELEDLSNKYDELQVLGVEVFSVSTDSHFHRQPLRSQGLARHLRPHCQAEVCHARRPHRRALPWLRRV